MNPKNDDETVQIDSRFLFQDSATGKASQAVLTITQICKLILGGTGAVTGQTQLLQLLRSGSYSNQWKTARETYGIRLVCESWYYEDGGKTAGPIAFDKLVEIASKSARLRVFAPLLGEWKEADSLEEFQLVRKILSPSHTSPAKVDSKPAMTESEQSELNNFLSSTDGIGSSSNPVDDDEASYVSDNGTRYVKEPISGRWIHEALAPVKRRQTPEQIDERPTKKQKKAKFAASKSKCWVYITGLPPTVDEAEVARVFSNKAGIIALQPGSENQPKVKLYRDKTTNELKGDASLCFARPESVELATTLLDGTIFPCTGNDKIMSVERAKFEQHGEQFDETRVHRVSNKQRAVAKLAAAQARDWDEGEFNGRLTGGRKGLRIIVLKGVFNPDETTDDDFMKIEGELRFKGSEFGSVEKITIFSKHLDGVVVMKFAQPGAASAAVKFWDNHDKIRASFWDGVTDFSTPMDDNEANEGNDRFGDWLETQQELPQELQLVTE